MTTSNERKGLTEVPSPSANNDLQALAEVPSIVTEVPPVPTNHGPPVSTEVENVWPVMQVGIKKVINLSEGVPEQLASPEYTNLVSTITHLCIQKNPHEHPKCLYEKYKEIFNEHINLMVLPALREKHDEFLLREFLNRWKNHKVMTGSLSMIFNYLDRYFIPRMRLPSLKEVGLRSFRDQVYAEMKSRIKDSFLSLIGKEREAGNFDLALIKKVMEIFEEITFESKEAYYEDFELAMLTDTAAYYSRKAAYWIEDNTGNDYMRKTEECIQRENEMARHYLDDSGVSKVLQKVQEEMLVHYAERLLRNVKTGCSALLRDEKVEDFSRMCRLFSNIPNGLESIAVIVRQEIIAAGRTLIKYGKDAANDKKAQKRNRHGAQREVMVMEFVKLHQKCMKCLSACSVTRTLVCKAINEGLETLFDNKDVPELLAAFCDSLLREAKNRQMSDEAILDTLGKVVNLVAYINDKDTFAELYRNKLAGRLLHKSFSDCHEQGVLIKLKQLYGALFTTKMEKMVTGMSLAKETQISFENYLNEVPTCNTGIDLSVTLLNPSSWPAYRSTGLTLPREMAEAVQVFNEFYQEKEKKRLVTWKYSLGTCVIHATFGTKSFELVLAPYQAAVLLLFNEASVRLSVRDVQRQLNLTEEIVVRLLHSLSCAKYKILAKDPSTETVTRTDYFTINTGFSADMRRVKISLPDVEEKKQNQTVNIHERLYVIQASIVRILKRRKVLPYQQLVQDCIEDLREILKPDPKVMKRCIEGLVSQEFVERDKENPAVFKYIA